MQFLTRVGTTEISIMKNQADAEIEFQKAMDEIEISKAQELAEIEKNKMTAIINAIGPETLVEIARAGPETQAKLLQSMGLKGYMITDGKNPVNLFNTLGGMLGGMAAEPKAK